MTRPRVARALLNRWTLVVAVVAVSVAGYFGWRHWTLRSHWRQGEEALAARRYADARQHFDAYLAIRPDDPEARLLAGRAARRARDYYEARLHLARALELGGDAEAVAVEHELIAVQQGDGRQVATLRERAQADDDLALAILEVLIQYDIDTYQLRRAIAGFGQYLERRPGDVHALLGRGYLWERFLSFADAIADYRQAVQTHPDNDRARLQLGRALLLAGTPQDALEQFQWLARRQPDKLEVRLGLGQAWRQLGEWEKARETLDAALKDHPEHAEALWERGQLAMDQAQPAEAEPFLRRAAAALPYDRRFSFSLYRCLLELGRDEEARQIEARVARIDADLRRLEHLRDEVMKHPDDARLRCEGGLLFLRNGEPAEAARWLRIALRLDPGLEEARQALLKIEGKAAP